MIKTMRGNENNDNSRDNIQIENCSFSHKLIFDCHLVFLFKRITFRITWLIGSRATV